MYLWPLFIFCCLIVMTVIYPLTVGHTLHRYPMVRLTIKGLGTLIAAALAGYGAICFPSLTSLLITVGLIICAIADIIIAIHFLIGTCIFFLGHMTYISAFLNLAPIQPTVFVLFFLLCFIIIVIFKQQSNKIKTKIIPYFFYGLVLIFELSIALLLPAQIGLRGFMAAFGVLQFSISDLLLAKRMLKKSANHYNYAVMWLYYSAQLFISLISLQPWLRA